MAFILYAFQGILLMVATFAQESDIMEHYHHEAMLQKTLLENYNRNAKPMSNKSLPINVDINLDWPRVENLDTATDTVTVSYMMSMIWQDPRLTWNASEYGGITSTRFRTEQLWVPDLAIFNRSPYYPEGTQKSYITVANGMVISVPLQTVSFFCAFDLFLFPYDTQNCTLVLATWTHNANEVTLTYQRSKVGIDIDLKAAENGYDHPQWRVQSMKAKIVNKRYACCPEGYTEMHINIRMKRIVTYFRYVLVGPAVFLALLVPIIFLIPVGSPNKVNFGMMILMSTILMILILQEAVPFDHATVPRIALYYFSTLILTVIAIVMSIVTTHVSQRGKDVKSPPAWLKSLCVHSRVIRCLLCVGTYTDDHSTSKSMSFLLENQEDDHELIESPDHTLQNVDISGIDGIRDVVKNTKVMASNIIRKDAHDALNAEWRDIANTLERLLFIIFLVAFLMSSIVFHVL